MTSWACRTVAPCLTPLASRIARYPKLNQIVCCILVLVIMPAIVTSQQSTTANIAPLQSWAYGPGASVLYGATETHIVVVTKDSAGNNITTGGAAGRVSVAYSARDPRLDCFTTRVVDNNDGSYNLYYRCDKGTTVFGAQPIVLWVQIDSVSIKTSPHIPFMRMHPAPRLIAAAVDHTWTRIFIDFDVDTNGGGIHDPTGFPCSSMFDISKTLYWGENPLCRWSSPRRIIANLGWNATLYNATSDTIWPYVNYTALNITNGTNPSWRSNILVDELNLNPVIRLQTTKENSLFAEWLRWVDVVLPVTAPTPILRFSDLPKELSVCDALRLDASATVGSGGRPMRSWNWAYMDAGHCSINHAEWLVVQSVVNTYNANKDKPVLIVPDNKLRRGCRHTFQVTVTNAWGQSATQNVSVYQSDQAMLDLSVNIGNGPVRVKREAPLAIEATIRDSPCVTSSDFYILNWTITTYDVIWAWSWSTPTDSVFVHNIGGVDRQQSLFYVPPNSLELGSKFVVNVGAKYVGRDTYSPFGKTLRTDLYIDIIVDDDSANARIQGPAIRQVRVGESFTLDGSTSLLLARVNSAVSAPAYSWSCNATSLTSSTGVIKPNSGATGCALVGTTSSTFNDLPASSRASATISVPGLQHEGRFHFSLRVEQTRGVGGVGTEVQTSSTVNVIVDAVAASTLPLGVALDQRDSPEPLPGSAWFSTATQHVQSHLPLHFAGSGPGASGVAMFNDFVWNWTVTRGLLDLTTQSVGSVSSPSLVLLAGSLAPGSTYTIRLDALAKSGGGQMGSLTFEISTTGALYGGRCFVSPQQAHSLLSEFELECSGWDSDLSQLPLRYHWVLPVSTPAVTAGQINASNALLELSILSHNAYVKTHLPPGDAPSFTTSPICQIFDATGAMMPVATKPVKSLPYPPMDMPTASNAFTYRGLLTVTESIGIQLQHVRRSGVVSRMLTYSVVLAQNIIKAHSYVVGHTRHHNQDQDNPLGRLGVSQTSPTLRSHQWPVWWPTPEVNIDSDLKLKLVQVVATAAEAVRSTNFARRDTVESVALALDVVVNIQDTLLADRAKTIQAQQEAFNAINGLTAGAVTTELRGMGNNMGIHMAHALDTLIRQTLAIDARRVSSFWDETVLTVSNFTRAWGGAAVPGENIGTFRGPSMQISIACAHPGQTLRFNHSVIGSDVQVTVPPLLQQAAPAFVEPLGGLYTLAHAVTFTPGDANDPSSVWNATSDVRLSTPAMLSLTDIAGSHVDIGLGYLKEPFVFRTSIRGSAQSMLTQGSTTPMELCMMYRNGGSSWQRSGCLVGHIDLSALTLECRCYRPGFIAVIATANLPTGAPASTSRSIVAVRLPPNNPTIPVTLGTISVFTLLALVVTLGMDVNDMRKYSRDALSFFDDPAKLGLGRKAILVQRWRKVLQLLRLRHIPWRCVENTPYSTLGRTHFVACVFVYMITVAAAAARLHGPTARSWIQLFGLAIGCAVICTPSAALLQFFLHKAAWGKGKNDKSRPVLELADKVSAIIATRVMELTAKHRKRLRRRWKQFRSQDMVIWGKTILRARVKDEGEEDSDDESVKTGPLVKEEEMHVDDIEDEPLEEKETSPAFTKVKSDYMTKHRGAKKTAFAVPVVVGLAMGSKDPKAPELLKFGPLQADRGHAGSVRTAQPPPLGGIDEPLRNEEGLTEKQAKAKAALLHIAGRVEFLKTSEDMASAVLQVVSLMHVIRHFRAVGRRPKLVKKFFGNPMSVWQLRWVNEELKVLLWWASWVQVFATYTMVSMWLALMVYVCHTYGSLALDTEQQAGWAFTVFWTLPFYLFITEPARVIITYVGELWIEAGWIHFAQSLLYHSSERRKKVAFESYARRGGAVEDAKQRWAEAAQMLENSRSGSTIAGSVVGPGSRPVTVSRTARDGSTEPKLVYSDGQARNSIPQPTIVATEIPGVTMHYTHNADPDSVVGVAGKPWTGRDNTVMPRDMSPTLTKEQPSRHKINTKTDVSTLMGGVAAAAMARRLDRKANESRPGSSVGSVSMMHSSRSSPGQGQPVRQMPHLHSHVGGHHHHNGAVTTNNTPALHSVATGSTRLPPRASESPATTSKSKPAKSIPSASALHDKWLESSAALKTSRAINASMASALSSDNKYGVAQRAPAAVPDLDLEELQREMQFPVASASGDDTQLLDDMETYAL